jgi:hypothetical protein
MPAPRGGHRRSGRNRHALQTAAADGRPVDVVQICTEKRRLPAGHTVTFMPKPLFEDNGTGMHTHSASGKTGSRCLPVTNTPASPRSALGHRRHPEALQGTLRLYQPHHQQLQTPGAGIRSSGEPGLLQPQPQCRRPHSHVLPFTQGQTHRIPHAGSVLQRLPGLLSSC